MSLRNAVLDAIELHQPEISDERIESICKIWHKAINASGIDETIAAKALEQIIYTSKFMPKPADVLELVGGSPDAKGVSAWADILKAVRSKSSAYRPVLFSDPQIHNAIETMGGWKYLHDVVGHHFYESSDMGYLKHDFIKSYKSSPRRVEYGYLVANSSEFNKEPLMIGSSEVCRQLLETTKTTNAQVKRITKKG